MGIEILPPDVNLSDHDFVVVNGDIRFGLDAVKGVGYQAVEGIKRAREEGGPFTSLWDFCCRVDARAVNKRAIEALIKCGAFGSTGATRKGMLSVLEQAQAAGAKQQQDLEIGQGSIFDLGMDDGGGGGGAAEAFAAPSHPPIPTGEFDKPELLAAEKESIGVFISAHPLKEVREALRLKVDAPLSELAGYKDGDWVTAGGILTACKKIRTKKGDPMMFCTLDDLEGCIEMVVFGNAIEQYGGALDVDEVVLVRGRVDHKDANKTCIVVQSVEPFQPTEAEVEKAKEELAKLQVGPEPLPIRVNASLLPSSFMQELKELLETFPGESDVILDMVTRGGRRTLRLGPSYRVSNTMSLRAELDQIVGPAALPAERKPEQEAATAAA
jgi:DNA polymerase-3 subunit alpha